MRSASSLSNIRLLGFFNFFGDFRLFGPILIIHFANVSGSYTLAGVLLAVKMVAQALFEIPTGILSDRLPRTQVTLLGVLAVIAAVLGYALAPGFEVLLLAVVLEGLGNSLHSGNNEALLWDSLAEHGRESEFHRHSGRVNAMFQIALAISSVLGGVIALWSLRWAVGLTVIPQLACVVVALMMREPEVHHDLEPVHPLRQVSAAFRNIVRQKDLRRLTVANAVDRGSECGAQFQPAFIAVLWPSWAIGLIRAVNHAMSFTGFWWSGRVIDRFGATKTLAGSSVVAGVLGLLAYGKPTIVSPALTPWAGSAYGTAETAKSLLLQQRFTDVERATMGSLGQFLGGFFYGCFAIAAGSISDASSPAVALLAVHVASLTTMPVYWWLHVSRRAGRESAVTRL